MCGIFGFVGKRERASAIDLNVALKSLHHRGPDDRGTFFGVSTRNPDLACAFAHTRLSILDLSAAGHQPMTTEDGRYTIVYNGEIYNFRELRAELEQLGERFVYSCDTEVVLRAFARWGVQTVERLRGIFAFVVWDRENGSVFLARDRLGVKPLYYTRRADGLAMASEIRTLLATGCAEARFSEQGLRTYFQYGSVYDPQTILANVESLLPGHYGTFDGSSLTIKSYWQPPTATIPTTNYDEALTSIRSGVRDAIATELASDVPLGIFLSGGVDSSAIAALASASGRTLHTFTVTFDEDAYSEAGAAAEVARRYSCEHHQVHMPVDTAVQELGGVLDALDQPSADGVNTYFVAKAARRAGLAVALSGLGGDELFAGYPNFRSFGMLMRAGKIAGPFAQWMSDTFEGQNTRYLKALDALGARGAPGLTYAALRSMFSKQQRRTLTSLDTDFVQNGHDVHSADPLTQFTRFELSHYLRNTLLRDTDVMSMAHS